jgi:HlyD family secretion protein
MLINMIFFKVKIGQFVLVALDSYKGKVFEAKVTSISPMMNETSKTFIVEAEFVQRPELMYPFISFEANIVIRQKEKASLIPVNYLINDSTVQDAKGKLFPVKTGLRDHKMIEILDGISASTVLSKPNRST